MPKGGARCEEDAALAGAGASHHERSLGEEPMTTTQDLTAWRMMGKTPASIRPQPRLPPRVAAILAETAAQYGLTVEALLGPSQRLAVAYLRQHAMFRLRTMEYGVGRASDLYMTALGENGE